MNAKTAAMTLRDEVEQIIRSDPDRWWTTQEVFDASTMAESINQVAKIIYGLGQKGLLKKDKRARMAGDKKKVKGSSTFLNIVRWAGDSGADGRQGGAVEAVMEQIDPVTPIPDDSAGGAAEVPAVALEWPDQLDPRRGGVDDVVVTPTAVVSIEATPREGFRCAVYSDGSAFVETADGSLELQPHETRVLLAYLDRCPGSLGDAA